MANSEFCLKLAILLLASITIFVQKLLNNVLLHNFFSREGDCHQRRMLNFIFGLVWIKTDFKLNTFLISKVNLRFWYNTYLVHLNEAVYLSISLVCKQVTNTYLYLETLLLRWATVPATLFFTILFYSIMR